MTAAMRSSAPAGNGLGRCVTRISSTKATAPDLDQQAQRRLVDVVEF